MSQDYHNQGLFSFSNVFEKPQEQQQHHIADQIYREKLRVQGFEPPPPLVAIEEGEESRGIQVYETAGGTLSEMFNFQTTSTAAITTELLQNQLTHNYRHPNQRPHQQQQQPSATDLGNEWFGNRQGAGGSLQVPLNHDAKDPKVLNNHDSITANYQHQHSTAESMQLFLMNPQPRSPSSPSSSHPTTSTLQGFPNPQGGHFGQFICGGASTTGDHFSTPNEIGGVNVIEGQGLSLSLSSSLQNLEVAKVNDLRMSGGEMLFFNQGASQNHHHQVHVGFGSSVGLVNVLRNSKYAKATQELLDEFCSVGRGQVFKKNKVSRNNNNANATDPSSNNPSGGGSNNNSSSSKDNLPPLSAGDRLEHQKRKVKLLSMLDEVDKRYNHYCEQMQMVVNSFDLVMGFGAAVPYTALAQKAMSRHFKCLKDAIATQLKQSCELLGEKDASPSGLTKGETPRLKILEQSLRQQRAFHQMGMMEQEAWRPQRGLPERSVNILRAWLFEHFLHPYPSDADKHLLARQTGLSKNQVSNWFINARVRLWKPMVEDMYQQESKEEDDHIDESQNQNSSSNIAQTPTPNISNSSTNTMTTALTPTGTETKTTATVTITLDSDKKSKINATENDPSIVTINRQCSSENRAQHHESMAIRIAQNDFPTVQDAYGMFRRDDMHHRDDVLHHDNVHCRDKVSRNVSGAEYETTNMGISSENSDIGSTMIRFGTTAGDVSLTLGLRHTGKLTRE